LWVLNFGFGFFRLCSFCLLLLWLHPLVCMAKSYVVVLSSNFEFSGFFFPGMTLKIRLEPSPGCGAPPTFRLRPTDTLDSILEWELQEVLASVNGWIASNWTGWGCSNFGWFFGCCCLVRFVRNDLLLREPLAEYVERIAEVMKISSMTLTVSRKVKSKGYGETSETVVKG
jgi:hypothetical protein